jgi:tripartite-type tricarboxylate transporter receptor subunit TctC
MPKRLLAVAAFAIAVAGLSAPVSAQDYPAQPIKMIIPFGPGGGTDIVGRILAEYMQTKLGKPVVVENKPGAGGIIGNELVANAAPDGYTIALMTAGQVIAAVTRKQMRYDTLTAFAPIGMVATASLAIVARPDFPANDVKELIAVAKKDPNKVVFASPGFAATQHFAGEMFKQAAGVALLHVPYKTTPEAMNAVVGKHADILFDTVSAILQQVESGQLKALAVTGKDRFPALPKVPTAVESGLVPGYDVTTWYGMFGPKGIPAPVVAKLNAVLNDALKDPEVSKKLERAGVIVKGSTPEEFGTFLADQYQRFAKTREAAGIPQQ